ncbi:MAG: hypothetical protein QOF36_2151 [Microbacteriaceae bacterium]|jgi:hypothetical protein|nr:hypothetical protein [Microbacteriaceae bacterium]MDQ1609836.1 hypothetical protein [Microbacteriaceae bacterium]
MWNLIDSTLGPGMTPGNPSRGESRADDHTMFLNGPEGVGGT